MATPPLQTNRDLYLAIETLSTQQEHGARTLESYLLAVLNGTLLLKDHDSLTLTEFYRLIAAGFSDAPAPFEDAWRSQYDRLPEEDEGFAGWYATLIRQIVDLREMDECGTLKEEQRYFGVVSPRGARWFNFEPASYLECALAGAFGGWEPGDETGRDYVPGHVAVLAEDGSIQTSNPEDVPTPTVKLSRLTWVECKDFLFCGRIYE